MARIEDLPPEIMREIFSHLYSDGIACGANEYHKLFATLYRLCEFWAGIIDDMVFPDPYPQLPHSVVTFDPYHLEGTFWGMPSDLDWCDETCRNYEDSFRRLYFGDDDGPVLCGECEFNRL